MSRIATFYSQSPHQEERTAALTGAALALAERGMRVLVVDWDGSSPALARVTDPGVGLQALLRWIIEAPSPDYREHVSTIDDSVSLLPYGSRAGTFDWEQFYAAGGGSALESLRDHWRRDHDIVLIDGGGGRGAGPAISLIQLADIAVAVVRPDVDEFLGMRENLRLVQRARQDLAYDRMQLTVVPIVAGLPSSDVAGLPWDAMGEFTKVWTPAGVDQTEVLKRLTVAQGVDSRNDERTVLARLSRLLELDLDRAEFTLQLPSGGTAPIAPAAATITITLCGELSVTVDGRRVDQALPGRRGRLLLAYLATHRDEPASRDELVDAVWGQEHPADGAALSVLLARVRHALGPDALADRGARRLALASHAVVDTDTALNALDDARHMHAHGDHAAALHSARTALVTLRRPLLPGLEAWWLDQRRRELSERRADALEIVAEAALAVGGAELEAERAARELIETEPFRERGYAILMKLQSRRGALSEALQTFDELRALGVEPSGALRALADLLLSEVPALAAAVPIPTGLSQLTHGAFVGRQGSLDHLEALWRGIDVRTPRLIVVTGEAGAGKTLLAAHFAEQAAADGATVLYGRSDPEGFLPYQPFVETLGQLLARGGGPSLAEHERAALAHLLPALGTAPTVPLDPEHPRLLLFKTIAALLARSEPLVLILEDLQWADEPTLQLMRYLSRASQARRLLMVGTLREGGHPLLEDLRHESDSEVLHLAPFDDAATGELVRRLGGEGVSETFVRRLRERTGGNPFFIEETVRALAQTDAPEQFPLPRAVAETIQRRVEHLSPLAADVLRVASVQGRESKLSTLGELVEGSPDAVIDAVEELVAAGLLLEDADRADGYSFAHELVREVVYRGLPAARRARLHLRVAESRERQADIEEVHPAELAYHFKAAQRLTGPERVRRYSIAAGERAAEELAYEESAAHYRDALELFDDDEGSRCAILLALGRVQLRAGNPAARDTYLEAARSARERGAADQFAQAAVGANERSWGDPYVRAPHAELLAEASQWLGGTDTPLAARVRAALAETLTFPEIDARAADLAQQTVAIALRTGDGGALAAALLARHVARLDIEHLDERTWSAQDNIAHVGSDLELTATDHHWRLYDLLTLGDVAVARDLQATLAQVAAELSQPFFTRLSLSWQGALAELAGDVELAEHSVRECSRLGHGDDALRTETAALFRLRLRQGRLADLAGAVTRLARDGPLVWPVALGLIHAETGDLDRAREIYVAELGAGPELVPPGIFRLTQLALLAELCVKVEGHDGAADLYRALAPYARRNIVVGYSSCWGPVDRLLALLAAAVGFEDLAKEHVQDALFRAVAMDAPLLIADIRADHPGVPAV